MITNDGSNQIEYINKTPVLRLRGRLLSLITLNEILKINDDNNDGKSENKSDDNIAKSVKSDTDANSNADADADADTDTGADKDNTLDAKATEEKEKSERKAVNPEYRRNKNHYIVVTQVGNHEFGIIVDRVFDTEEIVVKPVSKMLRNLCLFSGNTILGDGSVIMILDPNGIAEMTGTASTAEKLSASEEGNIVIPDSERKTPLLLFYAGDRTPKAVPLSLVSRLENVSLDKIEHSAGNMMVQYRDTLMPLVPFSPSMDLSGDGEKPVLVFSEKDSSMGLIIDEIIDITEQHINMQLETSQQGLLGSALINGSATDVIDVAYYLNIVNKDWFKDHGDDPFGEEAQNTTKRSLLLVDDSPFFRNMLTPLLSVAGYDVTTLDSPIEALKLCESGVTFDVIISDIEMPDMDGFEFAERVKKNSPWKNIPMVALSSHATPQDVDRGIKVGFNDYVAKFDKDTLLNSLSQTLSNTG